MQGHVMHNLSPVADIVAVGTIVGAFSGALPVIATILAILWYGVQLYDRIGRQAVREDHHSDKEDHNG
jgi:hypothetical protein